MEVRSLIFLTFCIAGGVILVLLEGDEVSLGSLNFNYFLRVFGEGILFFCVEGFLRKEWSFLDGFFVVNSII